MNIIVTNQNKDLIISANIEIMKELNGVFQVSEIANSFNSIFYKKLIIDATSLDRFPKEDVLKELAKTFDTEKLILFLPPNEPPPRKFLSFLVSINIYNFTDNVKGLVELVNRSNTYDDVKEYATVPISDNERVENNQIDFESENYASSSGQVILGVYNVTKDTNSTNLCYLLKKNLKEVYKKNVVALEIDKNDFVYYADKDMYSVTSQRLGEFFSVFSNMDVIIVDLANNKNVDSCTDIIYLVDPSLYRINQLMMINRGAFNTLKGKKVVLDNSLLSDHEISIFAKEAGISVYFNLPPLNDRIVNPVLNTLLSKLGLVEIQGSDDNKKGLFAFFNK